MSSASAEPSAAETKCLELEAGIDRLNKRILQLTLKEDIGNEEIDQIGKLTAAVSGLQAQLIPLRQRNEKHVQQIKGTNLSPLDLANKPKLKLNFNNPDQEFLPWWETFQDACSAHSVPVEECIRQVHHCLGGDEGGQMLLRNYLQGERQPPKTWREAETIIREIFKIAETDDLTRQRFQQETLTSIYDFNTVNKILPLFLKDVFL